MIKNISVKNFKSLKNVSIETKPLNLLMGLNGMGKSSFLQSLLLVKQSSNLYVRELQLTGRYADIGKGKDALFQFAKDEIIEIGISFSNTNSFNWKFNYEADADKLISSIGYKKEELNLLTKELSQFQYLSADRIGPLDIYDTQKSSVLRHDLGGRGEYTVHFLHINGNKIKIKEELQSRYVSDLSLINQVSGWLGEISPGISLEVFEFPFIDKLLLNYKFALKKGKTTGFRPKNVGFGVSFVLPIITSLLLPEKSNIIIIENPESHIHPRGQAELGRLIALSAANGAQLFIETHSDHIINGIRVAVKEGLINKNDVNISYFDKITTEFEQYSQVTQIKVDENGELSDYPKDFMDEWNNQLLKLI